MQMGIDVAHTRAEADQLRLTESHDLRAVPISAGNQVSVQSRQGDLGR
ncbi:MAG TPA: hypothetical protein VGD83_16525 [Streptosporangiaceae bacterium]